MDRKLLLRAKADEVEWYDEHKILRFAQNDRLCHSEERQRRRIFLSSPTRRTFRPLLLFDRGEKKRCRAARRKAPFIGASPRMSVPFMIAHNIISCRIPTVRSGTFCRGPSIAGSKMREAQHQKKAEPLRPLQRTPHPLSPGRHIWRPLQRITKPVRRGGNLPPAFPRPRLALPPGELSPQVTERAPRLQANLLSPISYLLSQFPPLRTQKRPGYLKIPRASELMYSRISPRSDRWEQHPRRT